MKLKKIFTLLAVLLLLGATLAFTVMAEGETDEFSVEVLDGKIISGLDFNKYVYKITPIRITYNKVPTLLGDHWVDFLPVEEGNETQSVTLAEAKTLTVNKFTTSLDDTSTSSIKYYANETYYTQIANENLAGLYKLRRFDKNSGAVVGEAITFYADGKSDEKQNLGTALVGKHNNSYAGTYWNQGFFSAMANTRQSSISSSSKSYTISSGDHVGYHYDYTKVNFVAYHAAYIDPAILIRGTEEGILDSSQQVTKETYAKAVSAYEFKYGLKANEIIPASSFNSITYGFSRTEGGVLIGSTKTKMKFLVYDASTGTIKTYEAIDEVMTNADATLSKHTITGDEVKLVKADGSLDDTQTFVNIASDKYIIGYSFFPVTDYDADDVELNPIVTTKADFPTDTEGVTEKKYIYAGGTYDAATRKYTAVSTAYYPYEDKTKKESMPANNFTLTVYFSEYDFDLPELTEKIGSSFGKITGLDFSKYSYQISPVLMKTQATDAVPVAAIADDIWLPLVDGEENDTTDTQIANENLAGLYKVKYTVADGYPHESYVYVDGKILDKQQLAKNAGNSDNRSSNVWKVGALSTVAHNTNTNTDTYIDTYSDGNHYGTVYGHKISFAGGGAPESAPRPSSYDSTTKIFTMEKGDTTRTVAQFIAAIEDYSVKYALRSQEIIPTTDFNSFTYAVRRVGAIELGQTKTKLEIKVYDSRINAIQTFVAIPDTLTSNTAGVETKHVVTAEMAKLVKPDGTLDNTVTLASFDADAYVIGYEIYAASGIDENAVAMTGTNNFYFGFKIYHSEYDVDIEKAPISDSITYDYYTNTLNNLTDDFDYYLATYDASGVNHNNYAEKLNVTNGVATIPDGYKGLLAVFTVDASGYLDDSTPFIFYAPSDEAGNIRVWDHEAWNEFATKNSVSSTNQICYPYAWENNSPRADTSATSTYNSAGTIVSVDAIDTEKPSAEYVGKWIGTGLKAGVLSVMQHYDHVSFTHGKWVALFAIVAKQDQTSNLDKSSFYYGFKNYEILPASAFDRWTFQDGTGFVQGGATTIYQGASFQSTLLLYLWNPETDSYRTMELISSAGRISARSVGAFYFAPTSEQKALLESDEYKGYYVMGMKYTPVDDIEGLPEGEDLFTITDDQKNLWCYTDIKRAEQLTVTVGSNNLVAAPEGITVKDGKLQGLEDDRYYQISPLTISSDGNGMLLSDFGDLNDGIEDDDEDNVFTVENDITLGVGVYAVRLTDKNGLSISLPSKNVIFLNSVPSKELAISDSTINLKANTNWNIGSWSGPQLTHIKVKPANGFYSFFADYGCNAMTADVNKDLYQLLYGKGTWDAEKGERVLDTTTVDLDAAAQKKAEMASELAALSYKYAYRNDEIMHVSDFASFNYTLYIDQGNIGFGPDYIDEAKTQLNRQTKLVAYVLTPDGDIVTYSAIDDKPSYTLTFPDNNTHPTYPTASNHLYTSLDLVNESGDALKDLEDGYVIGLEIYPMILRDPSTIDVTVWTAANATTAADVFAKGRFVVGVDTNKYKLVDKTPAAPSIELITGADAMRVTDYDENSEFNYDYAYSTDRENWIPLTTPLAFEFTEPGTTYYVKVADGVYSSESAEYASVTSNPFLKDTVNLILGGEIGIVTTFKMAAGATLNGVECYIKDPDIEDAVAKNVKCDIGGNSLTIYVPAKDRDLIVEYRFGDQVRTIESIANYISIARESFEGTSLTLVNAIDSYTTQAGVYFGDGDAVEYAGINSLEEATAPTAELTKDDDNLTYKGAALILEGKTAIRHYFALAGESSEGYVATVGDKELDIQKDTDNGVYYVDIADIGAKDIGTDYTVTIKNGEATTTITYSVLNYLKNKNDANTKIGNLARAMYDYYKAAVAFDEN